MSKPTNRSDSQLGYKRASTVDDYLVVENLGEEYLRDLLRVVADPKHVDFVKRIAHLSPEKYVTSSDHRWILSTIVSHVKRYGRTPTNATIMAKANSDIAKGADGISESSIEGLKNKIKNDITRQTNESEEFVMQYVYSWMVRKTMVDAHLRLGTALTKGNLLEAKSIFQEAQSIQVDASAHTNQYFSGVEDAVERRKNSEPNMVVPSGLPIDQYTRGGHRKGCVAFILAATNVGKTSTSVHIGASIVKQGYRVAHVTLETDEDELRLRYDAALLGLPQEEAMADPDLVVKKVRDLWSQYGNQDMLHFCQFDPGTLSPAQLDGWLEYLKLDHNFVPDVLIIDSTDDMVPDGRTFDHWNKDTDSILLRLIQIARKYKVAVWSTTQGNRKSLGAETVTLDMVSKAIEKVQRARLIIALCQSEEESRSSEGRVYIAKNTWGAKNITVPVTFDWAAQRIFWADLEPYRVRYDQSNAGSSVASSQIAESIPHPLDESNRATSLLFDLKEEEESLSDWED